MLVQDTSPAPRRERRVAETGPAPFAADPPAGRVFAGRRTIRSTDAAVDLATGPSGRGRTRAC